MDPVSPLASQNMEWYRKMIGVYKKLSREELQDLEQWEKQNLPSSEKATSDWPGWLRHIGPPPWKVRTN